MIKLGNGDLSRSMMMRRIGGELRETVTRTAAELATGQHADIALALRGNLLQLATVEHGLVQTKQRADSARFGATLLAAQQNVVSQVGQITDRLAPDLRTAAQSSGPDGVNAASARARAGFEDAIGLLNTKVAGRYIFAGVAGDQRPFADAQEILDALVSGLPPEPTLSDMTSHVAAWFGEGGPFESLAYLGDAAPSRATELGDGHSLRIETTGADTGIRETLAALALGAMAEMRPSAAPLADQQALMTAAAEALAAASDSRIAVQARIGTQEARAANALAHAEAKSASFQIIRTQLREADPYERATALESATQKLDALYMVTARLSRLSLTEYLR